MRNDLPSCRANILLQHWVARVHKDSSSFKNISSKRLLNCICYFFLSFTESKTPFIFKLCFSSMPAASTWSVYLRVLPPIARVSYVLHNLCIFVWQKSAHICWSVFLKMFSIIHNICFISPLYSHCWSASSVNLQFYICFMVIVDGLPNIQIGQSVGRDVIFVAVD